MIIRVSAIVVFLVVVAGGLLVHFREQSLTEKPAGNTAVAADIPVPPKNGPYGKFVVVGESVHNFGTMEQLQSGEHEFKVRNEGQGPLKLVARSATEDHSCQCTVGQLGQDGLKPGEETTVKLKWTIKSPATLFDHWAKIRSDDPQNLATTFRVRGLVGRRLVLKPGHEITVGTLSETQPTERVLTLHSEIVDAFEISKIDSSTPLITVVNRPLNEEEVKNVTRDLEAEKTRETIEKMEQMEKKMKESQKREGTTLEKEIEQLKDDQKKDELVGKNPDAKSGHELRVTFQSGFPIGKFRESITIHTTVPDSAPVIAFFEGNRTGPVQILGTPGIGWSPEQGILQLGRFSAAEGKKARLMVFVKKTEQEMEVSSIKVNPSFLKCEFHKDANFKGTGRDKFDLQVEVPAGGAPLTIIGEGNRGTIILETNHPDAKTIKLEVEFTSF